jgi:hypothetical protein
MKSKRIIITTILLMSIFGMASCSNYGQKTMYLSANYVYGHSTISSASGDVPVASLMFDSSSLGKGFEDVEVPPKTIAGDCLEIKYTGELITPETYPGKIVLNGELKSYVFHKASVCSVHVDDGCVTKKSFSDYLLGDDNIILNDQYEYININDSGFYDIWFTEKWVYVDPNDSTIYGPSIIEISGLFAFDPTSSN